MASPGHSPQGPVLDTVRVKTLAELRKEKVSNSSMKEPYDTLNYAPAGDIVGVSSSVMLPCGISPLGHFTRISGVITVIFSRICS